MVFEGFKEGRVDEEYGKEQLTQKEVFKSNMETYYYRSFLKNMHI